MNIFTPNPGPQSDFLATTVREVLFGGRASGGKTEGLLAVPLRQLRVEMERYEKGEIKRSKMWVIHFRKELTRLEQTIQRSVAFYKPLGGEYNDKKKMWRFPGAGDAIIQFAHLEGPNDHLNYAGPEYTGILWDEVTEIPQHQYMYLQTRLRTSDPILKEMLMIRAATNPAGKGLAWVRDRFIEPAGPEGYKIIRERIKLPDGTVTYVDRMFIPSSVRDTPQVDYVSYAATLVSSGRANAKALLDGDWYQSESSFFGDVFMRSEHIIEPFKIPPSWQRFRDCDYGYSQPSCVIWTAVNGDGIGVVYRILYVKRHTPDMLANRIRELEEAAGEWARKDAQSRIYGTLDPSCFNPNNSGSATQGVRGPTISETMNRMGCRFAKADNNRVAGWMELRRRLIQRIKSPELAGLVTEGGKLTKRKEFPSLMFFSNIGPAQRELPIIEPSQDNPDDVNTKQMDHFCDALRYHAMSRVMPEATEDTNVAWYLRDEQPEQSAPRRVGQLGYGGW